MKSGGSRDEDRSQSELPGVCICEPEATLIFPTSFISLQSFSPKKSIKEGDAGTKESGDILSDMKGTWGRKDGVSKQGEEQRKERIRSEEAGRLDAGRWKR